MVETMESIEGGVKGVNHSIRATSLGDLERWRARTRT